MAEGPSVVVANTSDVTMASVVVVLDTFSEVTTPSVTAVLAGAPDVTMASAVVLATASDVAMASVVVGVLGSAAVAEIVPQMLKSACKLTTLVGISIGRVKQSSGSLMVHAI